MTEKSIRPYRPGLWLRFVAPPIAWLAAILSLSLLTAGVLSREELSLAGFLLGLGLLPAVIAATAWRLSRSGLFVNDSALEIRGVLRSTRLDRHTIVSFELGMEDGPGRMIGSFPRIVMVGGDVVDVRSLARYYPTAVGGSSPESIVTSLAEWLKG